MLDRAELKFLSPFSYEFFYIFSLSLCVVCMCVRAFVCSFPFHFSRLDRSSDLVLSFRIVFSPLIVVIVWRESGGSSTCLFLHLQSSSTQYVRTLELVYCWTTFSIWVRPFSWRINEPVLFYFIYFTIALAFALDKSILDLLST